MWPLLEMSGGGGGDKLPASFGRAAGYRRRRWGREGGGDRPATGTGNRAGSAQEEGAGRRSRRLPASFGQAGAGRRGWQGALAVRGTERRGRWRRLRGWCGMEVPCHVMEVSW